MLPFHAKLEAKFNFLKLKIATVALKCIEHSGIYTSGVKFTGGDISRKYVIAFKLLKTQFVIFFT